jgi:hypothetical protein
VEYDHLGLQSYWLPSRVFHVDASLGTFSAKALINDGREFVLNKDGTYSWKNRPTEFPEFHNFKFQNDSEWKAIPSQDDNSLLKVVLEHLKEHTRRMNGHGVQTDLLELRNGKKLQMKLKKNLKKMEKVFGIFPPLLD